MNYNDFRRLRQSGKIRAGIDSSVALKLIDYLPKRYQHAHIFWSWVWMLSIPTALILMFAVKWWVGILVLVLVTPTVFSATKKSAVSFVLQHAEDNEEFFNHLVERELLVFKE